MIPLLNVHQIREADRQTMELKKISSVRLMEDAATAWTEAFLRHHTDKNSGIDIYCGPGNNGGDGLVIARLLLRYGFRFRVILPDIEARKSEDFQINLSRIRNNDKCEIIHLKHPPDKSLWKPYPVCIDALFGSGLSRPLSGFWEPWIEFINETYSGIYSVDIPSGLMMDQIPEGKCAAIRGAHVITFETVKKIFLFPEVEPYVRSWEVVPIGWPWEELNVGSTKEWIITEKTIRGIFRKRKKFSHKGDYGRLLIVAGSEEYPGAAVLCAGGALRSGTGLTYLYSVPEVCRSVLGHYPECIVIFSHDSEAESSVLFSAKYDAMVIGPGLGVNDRSMRLVKSAIHSGLPLVLDADALNILAENKTWLSFLRPGSILTPHAGEFDRVFGKCSGYAERFEKAREQAIKLNSVIVLKGAYTFIFSPDGNVFVNITSTAGLAKGGSGDVLCGMIASFLAQGYVSVSSAILGVYIHGRSAQMAIKNQSEESLLASDVISNLGRVFSEIAG